MADLISTKTKYESELDTSAIYLGEQTITGNAASQAATLPTGTSTVWVTAEGGAVYVTVNGTGSASSGVYVPDGAKALIGPYSNLTSLGVYAASGVKAHLIYEAQ